MDVVSACRLRVGSIVWQPRPQRFVLTVVCKATYQLFPTESPLAPDQDPINEADDHWNDDEARSLHAASDLAPFKRRADVFLVGHAYAPTKQPVSFLIARLLVGEVDKAIEVHADRVWRQDGQLCEGARFTRTSLRYERAAGGPDTSNPVGIPIGASPDQYGQVPIPNLQPPGLHVTRPGQAIPPIGFGPIAPAWPTRWMKLNQHAAGWNHPTWFERPLPEDIDMQFFNAAPPDQQVDELRSNERIVLENLDREHARLVTSLPGLSPQAVVHRDGAQVQPIPMRCDTLNIDTDRGICTLVWRGQVPLARPDEPGWVVITAEGAGTDEAPAPVAGSATAGRTLQLEVAEAPDPEDDAGPPPTEEPRSAEDRPLKGLPREGASDLPFRVGKPFQIGTAIPLGGLVLNAARPEESAEPPPPRGGDLSGLPFVAASGPGAASPLDLDEETMPGTGDPIEPALAPWEMRRADGAVCPPPPPFFEGRPTAVPERTAELDVPGALSGAPATPFFEGRPWNARVAISEPPPPPPEGSALPAMPPRIGPLATPEMVAAAEAPARLPSDAPPRLEATPVPVVATELPLDRYPITRCAEIAASRARREPDAAAILAENELTPDVWAALDQRWTEAIRKESDRGRTTLLKAYDQAYVARLEAERGPITAGEYARLVIAFERGGADLVLAELKLPRGIILRVQRVFLDRMIADLAFDKSVRAALEAESEREEE